MGTNSSSFFLAKDRIEWLFGYANVFLGNIGAVNMKDNASLREDYTNVAISSPGRGRLQLQGVCHRYWIWHLTQL